MSPEKTCKVRGAAPFEAEPLKSCENCGRIKGCDITKPMHEYTTDKYCDHWKPKQPTGERTVLPRDEGLCPRVAAEEQKGDWLSEIKAKWTDNCIPEALGDRVIWNQMFSEIRKGHEAELSDMLKLKGLQGSARIAELERILQHREFRICFYCGHHLKVDRIHCPSCKHRLDLKSDLDDSRKGETAWEALANKREQELSAARKENEGLGVEIDGLHQAVNDTEKQRKDIEETCGIHVDAIVKLEKDLEAARKENKELKGRIQELYGEIAEARAGLHS